MFDTALYHLKRPYHWLTTGLLEGWPARLRYGRAVKSLTLVGITGTDGKTTTSTLIYHLLNAAGIKTGLISTVGAFIGNDMVDTGLHVTSPRPRDLYQLLHRMKEAGCSHVVLEATSHGLYQHRFWGIQPEIAGLTNITHEHLDYHLTWKAYAEAKMLLLRRAKSVYVQAAEANKSFFHHYRWSGRQTIHRYDLESPLPAPVRKAINRRFPEVYNRLNATLACLIAQELGATTKQASALASFPGVPGRMEEIAKRPVRVIVDFAHTPNALENVLTTLRSQLSVSAKLIVVFGCAGERDIQKRPLMGEIATRLADLAIFTAEDPRRENVWSIIRQMKAGVTSHHDRIVSIPDRREAIDFALHSSAKKGDVVVVCGKGHERSMCFGTTETAWHDPTVVRELLESNHESRA